MRNGSSVVGIFGKTRKEHDKSQDMCDAPRSHLLQPLKLPDSGKDGSELSFKLQAPNHVPAGWVFHAQQNSHVEDSVLDAA